MNILSKVAEEQMAEFPLEPQWLEMLNEANGKAQTATHRSFESLAGQPVVHHRGRQQEAR